MYYTLLSTSSTSPPAQKFYLTYMYALLYIYFTYIIKKINMSLCKVYYKHSTYKYVLGH